jgi:hypothetical protein
VWLVVVRLDGAEEGYPNMICPACDEMGISVCIYDCDYILCGYTYIYIYMCVCVCGYVPAGVDYPAAAVLPVAVWPGEG